MPDSTSQNATLDAALKQTLGAYSALGEQPKQETSNSMLARVSSIDTTQTNPDITKTPTLDNKIDTPNTAQSVKKERQDVTGVIPPGAVVFKLKSEALEKQVSDLTRQVQDLINKIKEEQEKGKKAVLKATIESEGNAEKLQALVQIQREELLSLKNSLSVETKNSAGKDARIKELETALSENDSLLSTLGGNTYFGQGGEGSAEQAETTAAIDTVKKETATILENSRQKEQELRGILEELLAELEATTDCADIKKEIDDLAKLVMPQSGEDILPGTVTSNSETISSQKIAQIASAPEETEMVSTTQETQANETTIPEEIQKDAVPPKSEPSEQPQTVEVVTPSQPQEIALEAVAQESSLETAPEEPSANQSVAETETKDVVLETPVTITKLSLEEPQNQTLETTSTEIVSSQVAEPLQEAIKKAPEAPPTPETAPQGNTLSKETISALFAAAPIATGESYLVSPFGFLSKETAARDLASFPENLTLALSSKNPSSLIDVNLYNTYKDTSASSIYLSSGSFGGTVDERIKLSAFIRSLLTFFLPNHISTIPEKEVKDILSTATISALWATTCQMYDEEKSVSSSSLTSLIMENLGLTSAAIEEKQATLREIVDAVYAKFLNPLLGRKATQSDDSDSDISPILEALRKAFEMDEKELLTNKTHNYQFFMIALKNFLLRESERREIVQLFEEAREETLEALTENDAQKAEILRLFEKAKEETVTA